MEFRVPELGEGVHEGELVKWLVKPGDKISFDQPLCEIMTDKATIELPSAVAGKVEKLHAKEGETVKVNQVLLTFEGAAAAAAAASAAQATAAKPTLTGMTVSAAPPASGKAVQASGASIIGPAGMDVMMLESRPLASPSTRRLARESGIDLRQVRGTGPAGRILREDLERGGSSNGTSHSTPSRTPTGITSHAGAKEERVPLKGLRRKISEKMRQSMDHAAHFTYVEEADATALVALRNSAKKMAEKSGVKVTYLPFVMKAMVAALKHYPILNASLDEEKGEIVYKYEYNIGLSIQTEDGLTAPNIKNVDQKSVLELAREIQDVVERARTKHLTQEDFAGGTITLTNAGSIGGLFATPIINYPEVAIVGLNKIFRKPVAITVDGTEQIVVRDWTYFSISLDHRIVDGAIAAEFMKRMIQYIENPALLVLG